MVLSKRLYYLFMSNFLLSVIFAILHARLTNTDLIKELIKNTPIGPNLRSENSMVEWEQRVSDKRTRVEEGGDVYHFTQFIVIEYTLILHRMIFFLIVDRLVLSVFFLFLKKCLILCLNLGSTKT